jgi:hypothetical protein
MTSRCRATSIYIAARIRVKFEIDEPTTKCFSSTNGQCMYGGGGTTLLGGPSISLGMRHPGITYSYV